MVERLRVLAGQGRMLECKYHIGGVMGGEIRDAED
jgi:hypothetical protein